ncbi:MAG: DUF502 domain-containing protein [Verrucomicrobiaceae bacterium]|nr:DUF502 domain-containing protein [Verrucomicrobiaceae bacterium]
MNKSRSQDEKPRRSVRRYFLTGLVSIIPLWITWLILSFLFRTLSGLGTPFIRWLARIVGSQFPEAAMSLRSDTAQSIMAVILVLVSLFLLGWFTTNVVGRRLFSVFEKVLDRIPFVKSVYGSVKKLMTVLQESPSGDVQRVVLIDFPSPEMKTVGLVTRMLKDSETGRELAAVYVPTTPNPTSGYLEIVPADRIVSTDWSIDEAMAFIVSGGAIAPDRMNYDKSAQKKVGG